jgi:primary-amine oxidase
MRILTPLAFAAVCIAGSTTIAQTPAARPTSLAHPLDPLTAAEIRAAVAIAKTHASVPAAALFPVVALQEPSKEEVGAFTAGRPFSRRALVVILDREQAQSFEAVVDLRGKSVESVTPITHGQPLLTDVELQDVAGIVRADGGWQ